MDDGVYVCPDCKTLLHDRYCAACNWEFPCVHDIPSLLSRDRKFEAAGRVAAAYDSIYRSQSNVWENQGRTPEFIQYFCSLLSTFPRGRLLEIGCGEGILLASLTSREKFATDLSLGVLERARARTPASFLQALAERLPFPPNYFDLVAAVGVMEHFLDTEEALREIRRVLKPGGHYVSLVHVDVTFWERVGMKVSRFVYPRPRPVELVRWLKKRMKTSFSPNGQEYVQQPIQNRFTTRSAKACLGRTGFDVREVIHRRKDPSLPLMGPWVVIYVAQK